MMKVEVKDKAPERSVENEPLPFLATYADGSIWLVFERNSHGSLRGVSFMKSYLPAYFDVGELSVFTGSITLSND